MKNQIVILAAGKGTRMNHEELPKVLIPLKGKPIISYLLEEVGKIDLQSKPIVVVGYKHDKVEEALGQDFVYALQVQQLGTAHAVMAAKGNVQAENILVLNGDHPLLKAASIQKLVNLHQCEKAILSMLTVILPDFEGENAAFMNFGRVIRDQFGNIVKITEFKDASEEEKRIREVNPAMYMFNTEWLWSNLYKIQNHNAQKEYYLTDIIELAIKDGIKINSLNINPREGMGINTVEQLKAAEKFI